MKLLLLPAVFALGSATHSGRSSARQLATFPGFAENIAVRHSGDILVTSLTTSSIQLLDPRVSNVTVALPPIPGANGISGIVEVEKDFFAVAAGIWNTTERRETNASVWMIDFRQSPSTRPALKKVVNIPETTALNSFTSIPGSSIVLGSDSNVGAIYSIDIGRRTYSIVNQDNALAPPGPAPSLGVNGIKVYGSYLYFANSGTGVLGRFPISRTGLATGPVQPVSQFNGSTYSGPDDFVIDEDGTVWISFHPNTIYKVDKDGKQEAVVSGDQILDPTSVTLGRGGEKGKRVLYASVNLLGEQIIGGVAEIEI
ncbi:hypothetical protein N0V90_004100 [Kalmusia sp. IMI 367209]|nr:hypothetical protein N0V90_004100 [Kalmusia sp. IMI 367209]